MTYEEARALAIFESCIDDGNTDGMIVRLRMGGDPGSARVQKLLNGLKIISERHLETKEIELKLACALHFLAQEIINQTSGTPSREWSKEFLQWERFDIQKAAEAVLLGGWPDTWLSYGKRK